MFDENGDNVTEAGPSRPVQILGMSSVPSAGDSFLVATDDRTARQIADKREAAKRAATLAKRRKRISLENLNEALKEGNTQTLNLILKGDASGSVEAPSPRCSNWMFRTKFSCRSSTAVLVRSRRTTSTSPPWTTP